MQKYYFLSDAHIGTRAVGESVISHERKLVDWLDMASQDATEIFLVGDIFDFWFEYKRCVPKGFCRLLGKLAELTDRGIGVHFFIGNHDLWTFGYLEEEIGLKVHKVPLEVELLGKKFFIAHGDGLRDTSGVFRFTRKLFHSKFLQKCFGAIHPNIGIKAGISLSNKNRLKHGYSPYRGEKDEPLVVFAKEYNATKPTDYFIFGHRHILLNLQIAQNSQLAILGDFYEEFSYAVFDESGLSLHNFLPPVDRSKPFAF